MFKEKCDAMATVGCTMAHALNSVGALDRYLGGREPLLPRYSRKNPRTSGRLLPERWRLP